MSGKGEMSTFNQFSNNVSGAPPSYDQNTGIYPTIAHTEPSPQTQMIMINQPQPVFGPQPIRIRCPSCNETNVSEIRYESNMKTHIIATILFITTCCCCIPYCIDSCKSANHICKNCGAYLGSYSN